MSLHSFSLYGIRPLSYLTVPLLICLPQTTFKIHFLKLSPLPLTFLPLPLTSLPHPFLLCLHTMSPISCQSSFTETITCFGKNFLFMYYKTMICLAFLMAQLRLPYSFFLSLTSLSPPQKILPLPFGQKKTVPAKFGLMLLCLKEFCPMLLVAPVLETYGSL